MGSPGYEKYSNLILQRKKHESSLHGLTQSKVINPKLHRGSVHGDGSPRAANQTAGPRRPTSQQRQHGLYPRGGDTRNNSAMFSGPHFKAVCSEGNSVTEGAEEWKFGAQKSCLFYLLTLVETASALKHSYK